jgi:Spy/CpxP family protein refolding chaperone
MWLGLLLEDGGFAASLGVTPEQKATLREYVEHSRERMKLLREKMEATALEQARLLTQPDIDEPAVMDSVERLGALRTELAKLRIRQLLILRDTLTPEQIEKARGLMRERMARRREELPDRDRPERPRREDAW